MTSYKFEINVKNKAEQIKQIEMKQEKHWEYWLGVRIYWAYLEKLNESCESC